MTLRIPGKFMLLGPSKLLGTLTLMPAASPGSFGTLAHYFILFWITTFLGGSSKQVWGKGPGRSVSFLPPSRKAEQGGS